MASLLCMLEYTQWPKFSGGVSLVLAQYRLYAGDCRAVEGRAEVAKARTEMSMCQVQ